MIKKRIHRIINMGNELEVIASMLTQIILDYGEITNWLEVDADTKSITFETVEELK